MPDCIYFITFDIFVLSSSLISFEILKSIISLHFIYGSSRITLIKIIQW